MTIGVSPDGSLNQARQVLSNDLRLVKAALLYADHATLCSPASTMILTVLMLAAVPERQQIEVLRSWLSEMAQYRPDGVSLLEQLEDYRRLSQLHLAGPLTREELYRLQRMHAHFRSFIPEMVSTVEKIAEDAGAGDIIDAMASGILELHTFDELGDSDALVKEFVTFVSDAVSDAHTHPLFDDRTGMIVKAAIDEGVIQVSEAAVARGKHTALASNLFDRLPLFENASVEEILAIRRELDKPLTNFRSAVIRFSGDIRTAYWDGDFASDCQLVFLREVMPAVQEIEEAMRSNKFVKRLIRGFREKPLSFPAGSGIAMVMSQFSTLPGLLAQSLGIGLPAAALAYDAFEEWREERQQIEQNQLYFYHQARRSLSKNRA
jgi:hypothetical protein